MKREALVTVLTVGSIIMLGWLAFIYEPPERPVLSPATKQLAESIAVEKPKFDVRQDSTEQRIVTRAPVRKQTAAEDFKLWGQRLQDSLALAAAKTIQDSIRGYQQQVITLKAQVANDSLRIATLTADSADLRRGWNEERNMRYAGERLILRLNIDIANITHCKIAGLLPCPTRKQAVVGGVVIGLVGGAALVGRLAVH